MASESKKLFAEAMKKFIAGTVASMEAARELAMLSIREFSDEFGSGNLSYAQQFIDAIQQHGKNYVRRNAFLAWLAFHSPVLCDETGKVLEPLTKDKGPDAKPFKIAAAETTPFWEFKPEAPQVPYSAETVVQALKRTVGKFSGTRYTATGNGAIAVGEAVKMIARLEVLLKEPFKAVDQAEVDQVLPTVAGVPAVADTTQTETETPVSENEIAVA